MARTNTRLDGRDEDGTVAPENHVRDRWDRESSLACITAVLVGGRCWETRRARVPSGLDKENGTRSLSRKEPQPDDLDNNEAALKGVPRRSIDSSEFREMQAGNEREPRYDGKPATATNDAGSGALARQQGKEAKRHRSAPLHRELDQARNRCQSHKTKTGVSMTPKDATPTATGRTTHAMPASRRAAAMRCATCSATSTLPTKQTTAAHRRRLRGTPGRSAIRERTPASRQTIARRARVPERQEQCFGESVTSRSQVRSARIGRAASGAPSRRKYLTCVVHFVGLVRVCLTALPGDGAWGSCYGPLALPTFPPQLFIDLPPRRAFAPRVARAKPSRKLDATLAGCE